MTFNGASETDMQTEKVSVVMCTYNGSEFIIPQLESIVHQTYPIHELLIFDDASKDDTAEKVASFASQYSYIKLIVNERNLGFTKNFEQALKAASGNVLSISDQDDVWFKEKIKRMMAVWNKTCPIIYCNSAIFEGSPTVHYRNPKNKMFEGKDGRKLFMVNSISGHSMLIRKDFLPLILPFPPKAMYDWWIGVVAAYNGGVQHVNEVLVFQRKHAQNITVRVLDQLPVGEKELFIKKQVIDCCEDFLSAPNIPPKHKDFLEKFLQLLKESLHHKLHIPLFLFIAKNRKILLHYKWKSVSIFSRIKHSYIRARTLAAEKE